MEEQLTLLETSKIAKEKGFNYKPEYYYFPNDKRDGYHSIHKSHYFPNALKTLEQDYFAGMYTLTFPRPSQSLLQKWLRDKHGIHILIIPTITANWTYKTMTVISERDNDVIIGVKYVSDIPPYKEVCGEDFSTYELALEGALQESLKLIP